MKNANRKPIETAWPVPWVSATKGFVKSESRFLLLGLVEQLRQIIGLSLDEAIKHNPLANDDLAVPRFLVDCIHIIDQGRDWFVSPLSRSSLVLRSAHPQDNVYRQEPVKIKQPADLENALKQPLTPAFAVSLLKRFLKELPEQLIPAEQTSAIFKVMNDPGNFAERILENDVSSQVWIRAEWENYGIFSRRCPDAIEIFSVYFFFIFTTSFIKRARCLPPRCQHRKAVNSRSSRETSPRWLRAKNARCDISSNMPRNSSIDLERHRYRGRISFVAPAMDVDPIL